MQRGRQLEAGAWESAEARAFGEDYFDKAATDSHAGSGRTASGRVLAADQERGEVVP